MNSEHLKPERESELLRLHGEPSPGYLADATPPAFEGILLVFSVILFNLLCEESVEDLVDQLGGGRFCGAFVLLLGGMTDGSTFFVSGRKVPIMLAGWGRVHGTLCLLCNQVFNFIPAASLPSS